MDIFHSILTFLFFEIKKISLYYKMFITLISVFDKNLLINYQSLMLLQVFSINFVFKFDVKALFSKMLHSPTMIFIISNL